MVNNQNNRHISKPLAAIQPSIGVDGNARQSVVNLLNLLLSDEAVLITKTRSAHWNMSALNCGELHTLFETQSNQLNKITAEIAERVSILGGFAFGSLKEFLAHTHLEENPNHAPGILNLLADHETIIRSLRGNAEKCKEEYEDEGSYGMLVNILRMHEKMAWMLRSHVVAKPIHDITKEISNG